MESACVIKSVWKCHSGLSAWWCVNCTLYVCGVSPSLALIPSHSTLFLLSPSLPPLPLLLPPPTPCTTNWYNGHHLCRLSGSLFSISYISDLLSAWSPKHTIEAGKLPFTRNKPKQGPGSHWGPQCTSLDGKTKMGFLQGLQPRAALHRWEGLWQSMREQNKQKKLENICRCEADLCLHCWVRLPKAAFLTGSQQEMRTCLRGLTSPLYMYYL